MTTQEIAILEETVEKLRAIVDDAFTDPGEWHEASKAMQEAEDRLHTLLDQQSGHLTQAEKRVTIDGKSGVVNQAGYIEPDIANPRPVEPIPDVIEPVAIEDDWKPDSEYKQIDVVEFIDESLKAKQVFADLRAGDIMHYEEVAEIAAELGIDSLRVSQLHSQLEALHKEECNSPLGIFTLRVLVENAFLHKNLAEMNQITSFAVGHLNKVHMQRKQEVKEKVSARTRRATK